MCSIVKRNKKEVENQKYLPEKKEFMPTEICGIGEDLVYMSRLKYSSYWFEVIHKRKESKELWRRKTRQNEIASSFVRWSSSSSCLPLIPPPHSPSLPSLFSPLLFYPSLKYKTCLLYSLFPPLSLHPRVVTLGFFIWSHCACTSMADQGVRRQHRQPGRRVGFQRLLHRKVHSLVSCISSQKKIKME